MFELPRKQEQQTVKVTPAQAQKPGRVPAYTTLVPTLIGSMVVMMPRRMGDISPEWPDRIPPIE